MSDLALLNIPIVLFSVVPHQLEVPTLDTRLRSKPGRGALARYILLDSMPEGVVG
jgi:hypothetical protein